MNNLLKIFNIILFVIWLIVFLQDDRFFLVLCFVFMLLSHINVCSWIFSFISMGGENPLSAQGLCVLLGLAALG